MSVIRSFGMIPSGEDPKDHIYSGTHIGMPSIPKEYEIPNKPMVLDQGSSPICAAISIASIMEWQSMAKDPNNKGKAYDPFQIYNMREDKTVDGMIPRQALSAVKKNGVKGDHIEEFARVTNYDMIKMGIICNGPVMIGMAAYEDPTYFWKPVGKQLGGHAVVLVGWNEEGYVLQNSWGVEYGRGGRVIMPFEDEKYILETWTVVM